MHYNLMSLLVVCPTHNVKSMRMGALSTAVHVDPRLQPSYSLTQNNQQTSL